MNAVKIIDLLTRDSFESTGVFTINENNINTYKDMVAFFGDGLDCVYDPNDIFNLEVNRGEKPRNFLYIYDKRFVREFDKEIYAVLSRMEGDDIISLIYLYEID